MEKMEEMKKKLPQMSFNKGGSLHIWIVSAEMYLIIIDSIMP